MEIQQIKSKYDNVRTYENARSKLKRVNALLNLEPVDVIHTEQYVNQFDNLTHLLMTVTGAKGGMVKSKDELKALVGAIAGAVSRTLPIGQVNPLTKLITKLKASDIPNPKPVSDAEPWDVILSKFDKVIQENPNTFAKIVAVCYKHGYVLRIGEIFNTSTTKIYKFNYLDLDNLEWQVPIHKGIRKFTVTKEFADELRPLLSDKCPLLIFKSTLQPYTIQTHAVVDLDELPSNSEIRSSYQQWNWSAKSGRTKDEQMYWCTNVMGNSEITAITYYTAPEPEPEPQMSLAERIANRKPGDPKIVVVIRKKNA